MKALLKTGETIEIVPNDDFCAAKYINKETSEYVFNDEIVEIINEEIMAKYIDVDLLRKEIERLRGIGGNLPLDNREQKTGYNSAMIDIEAFLSTLESERPEPYNPVYDEAYLNEKIKKATESWKGVDVDAMLAECRGYDEEKSEKPMNLEEMEREEELKKAVHQVSEEIVNEIFPDDFESGDFFTEVDLKNCITRVAYQFADWGAEHLKK